MKNDNDIFPDFKIKNTENSGFSVPENYFKEFPETLMQKIAEEQSNAKQPNIRTLVRTFAVAASIIIAVAGGWVSLFHYTSILQENQQAENIENTLSETEAFLLHSVSNEILISNLEEDNLYTFEENIDEMDDDEIIDYLAYSDFNVSDIDF